ncbi:nucleotide sugar dehydrogenase [Natrinema salsiterrestre]|uniref:UDP-N-acetyl-D-mannosamine dehydrogenase n=1 Tax=Natrinema salsiterrestre TaxID=2950540 RepID=A0A9Q4Q0B9_9EURY|nr:nucleotide sugar dehydrogenase [Natrinema salsiterrestre]MDF9743986.1 nucleotide sugar dehydrogenase [Natrinema salsiterrestre]
MENREELEITETNEPSLSQVACIGLGFVGYHSAIAFCESGKAVVGIDIDDDHIRTVRNGTHPFETNGLREFLDRETCTLSTRVSDAADCDCYVISVPTPLDERDSPDLSALRDACQQVSTVLDDGDLVVLQSTVYPGCTRDELRPILERSGLEAGADFGLSHVPERYSPSDERSRRAPRVVGSIDEDWRAVTAAMYRDVTRSTVPVSSLEVAEAIKLVENIQRDVNIAVLNELTTVTDALGIDIWNVIEGAETKWNFHRYEPRLGVGGHCLPVDPHYFRTATDHLDEDLELVMTARDVNGSMPGYYGDRIAEYLASVDKPVSEATVAVLGLSYKPNVEDPRNSPSVTLIRHLRPNDIDVAAFDPQFQPNAEIEGIGIENGTDAVSTVRNADVTVVGTGHDDFQRLQPATLGDLMADDPLLVDVARLLDTDAVDDSDLVRLRDYLTTDRANSPRDDHNGETSAADANQGWNDE